MMMVDVTHISDISCRDIVTLIGHDGDEQITAETLASKSGTIHYEVLARINPLIPRVPVD